MSPAARLADLLADARRDGATFEDAWTAAVENVLAGEPDDGEREAWRSALDATRSGWRAAWERRPVKNPERALSLVEAREPGVPLPEGGCACCGSSLAGRAPHTRYCSRACARAAYAARAAA